MKRKLLAILTSALLLCTMLPLGAVSVNAATTTHYHSVCGTDCSCSNPHSKQNWQPLPTGTTRLTSGNYYLESSINFTGTNRLTIAGNVSICLNGYNIYKNGDSTILSVTSGTLTLTDCKGTGQVSVKASDKISFMGGGALTISDGGSLDMYGGTVISDALVAAIYCDTTGNLSIHGGNVTAYYEAIGIRKVNDVAIDSGTITSTNGAGMCCGETYSSATFHNVTISGGYFEGKKNGVAFGWYTCTGKVTISGGEFYGKGPEPNATTYGYEYYGLAFGSSAGGSCNLTISGGIFRGARGGFYNYNPQLNVTISDGTFHSKYTQYTAGSSGIEANNGMFLIEGGTIYGIQCVADADTRITVIGGEILCIQGNSGSSGVFTLKVYGGTIGRAGTQVATDGIISFSGDIEIYQGTILGKECAIDYITSYSGLSGSILVSGGVLAGETADIYMGAVGTTAENAYLSMEGYTGSTVTVALPSSVSNNAYVAKNVSRKDLIALVDAPNCAKYDSTNKAIMVGVGQHTYYNACDATCNACGAVRKVAGHVYDNDCDYFCNTCGEYRSDPPHGEEYKIGCSVYCVNCKVEIREEPHLNILYVAAKQPTCYEEGNIEHWYCENCGMAWLDAEYTVLTNLMKVKLPTTDHAYDNAHDADCNVCGAVRELDIVYGDVSGDGAVNSRDLALLQQYTADWDVTIDEVAADVNASGSINARDVALLQQYIAGWDVELG